MSYSTMDGTTVEYVFQIKAKKPENDLEKEWSYHSSPIVYKDGLETLRSALASLERYRELNPYWYYRLVIQTRTIQTTTEVVDA